MTVHDTLIKRLTFNIDRHATEGGLEDDCFTQVEGLTSGRHCNRGKCEHLSESDI
jgi:hypothetical protein